MSWELTTRYWSCVLPSSRGREIDEEWLKLVECVSSDVTYEANALCVTDQTLSLALPCKDMLKLNLGLYLSYKSTITAIDFEPV